MPGRANTSKHSGRSAVGSANPSRRQGRRSLSAYGSRARGTVEAFEGSLRWPAARYTRGGIRSWPLTTEHGAWSAGSALALVYPLLWASQGRSRIGGATPARSKPEASSAAKTKPSVRRLDTISAEEARDYLSYASGDELRAGYVLAVDRNRLDGSLAAPDEADVHHALYLLCRALGRLAPSFDEMRVELRRLTAA